MIEPLRNIRTDLFHKWIEKGVVFIDLATIYIDDTVELSENVIIGPMTVIKNNTYIGSGTEIKEFSVIDNSIIGANNTIWSSTVVDSNTANNVNIGPYSFIRGNCNVKSNASIGAHSELNDTVLGEFSKCKHFSYLGHATIGNRVNIGAGTVTCNYDGKDKFKTSVQDQAFIGSGTMLIAPVAIGRYTMIGAGSIVTKNIPNETLAFGSPAVIKGKTKMKED
jgi:bifunctional UDP-N-acetylglucosamine pyrophosphorylase/glucosamine-1-phosphate N-acetyltransferase